MKQIKTTKDLKALDYFEKLIKENGLAKNDFTISSMLKLKDFLQTEVQLKHFIPAKKVDGKWVVLEEPEYYDKFLEIQECELDNPRQIGWTKEECNLGIPRECKEYQKAEQEVLFKGKWEFLDSIYEHNKKVSSLDCHLKIDIYKTTIQDLIPLGLELTENAIDKL